MFGQWFLVLLSGRQAIDSVMMDSNYTYKALIPVIYRDLISPVIQKAIDGSNIPNWEQCVQAVEKQCGQDYAERVILLAQIRWYLYKKD